MSSASSRTNSFVYTPSSYHLQDFHLRSTICLVDQDEKHASRFTFQISIFCASATYNDYSLIMKLTYFAPLLLASSTTVLSFPTTLNTTEPTNSTLLPRDQGDDTYIAAIPYRSTGLQVSMFSDPGCKGQSYNYKNIPYGKNWAKKDWKNGQRGIQSYWLSRSLDFPERIDWKVWKDGDKCGKDFKSTPFKNAMGCHNVEGLARCWNLMFNPRAKDH